MATVSEMAIAIGEALNLELAQVRGKVRLLQDHGILPLASGRAVPSISHRDLAAALIAIAGSDRVKDAAKAYIRLADLCTAYAPDGAPERVKANIEAKNPKLIDWVTDQIRALAERDSLGFPSGAAQTVYSFVRNWPELEVSWLGGDNVDLWNRFKSRGTLDTWEAGSKHSFAFNGVTLALLTWRLFPAVPQVPND